MIISGQNEAPGAKRRGLSRNADTRTVMKQRGKANGGRKWIHVLTTQPTDIIRGGGGRRRVVH
jgi:hypothetical protein